MFYLQELPNRRIMEEFSSRYKEMDISATHACLLLLRVGSDLLTSFENLLKRHGLSQGRFLVLLVLLREPEEYLSPSVLAEKLGIKKATLTGLLDGLENEGLIVRTSDLKDRRKLAVKITPNGALQLDKVLPHYFSWIRKLMSCLDEDARETMSMILEKLGKEIVDV